LISPTAVSTAVGLVPRVKRFVVVGVFESGMGEYDAALVYTDLPQAQKLFDLGDDVSGIEVRALHIEDVRRVRDGLREALGQGVSVRDWADMNVNLFSALRLEKYVYSIVLLLIVLVATFNIVAMLVMVVMEKRRDIAVLKSMGATPAAAARIFVYKGMIVGAMGTLIGSAGGFLLCWLLDRYKVGLPAGMFYTDTLPVRMYPEYFAAVAAASLLICLLATLYPARQAALLAPVDTFRYA
jgi:lipoprotein-releasing system permease protein